MVDVLRSLWRSRQLIRSSVRADFAGRFARSRLGVAWAVLHPLLQSAVLAFVLSGVMAARLQDTADGRYALYLLAGMLAWAPFAELVSRSATMFIDNATLLKKLTFPRVCLPAITAASALVNNALLVLATIVVFLALGKLPTAQVLWLPALAVLTFALGISSGVILGILNVFVRDVGHVVTVSLQLMFWAVPIVYVPSVIPEKYLFILQLNPMYHLVTAYQSVLVFDAAPRLEGLLYAGCFTTVLLVSAFALFRRASHEIVDVL